MDASIHVIYYVLDIFLQIDFMTVIIIYVSHENCLLFA